MLTQEYRPTIFKELKGQKLAKLILKNIVENPKDAPKSLILHGNYGTGKSSAAQLFARALNCKSSEAQLCGNCEVCTEENINKTSYYYEFDSSVSGNKESLNKIKGYMDSIGNQRWRVINFEEFQVVQPSVQTGLLKKLEEIGDRVFIVFCTTRIDKLLNTIRSRSLEIKFEKLEKQPIINNLRDICKKENTKIKDENLHIIADKSNGSLRDAQMLLNKLFTVGEKDFEETFIDTKEYFAKFILASLKDDKNKAVNSLNKLNNQQLEELEQGFYKIILEISGHWIDFEKSSITEVKEIVDILDNKVMDFIKISRKEWMINSFQSNLVFESSMRGLYQILSSW